MFLKQYREIMDHIVLHDKQRKEILKAVTKAKIEHLDVQVTDTSK